MYQDRNYLRVRGEYESAWSMPNMVVELPPRTRRIRVCLVDAQHGGGTTSAYAENTAKPA